MIISTVSETGIILPGERSQLVTMLSDRLCSLGYFGEITEILSPELITALNLWRSDNSLPALDYVDPLSLRLLGFEVGGDELIFLARHAEPLSTEVERYAFCRSALENAKLLGVSVVEYLAPRVEKLPNASLDSLRCAIIASLMLG